MSVTPIKFGTDGWRAIIAEDYTFENVRACAQGVADYLHATGSAGRGLVVGYDTRFASEEFANAVAEVAAASGVKVYLSDRARPTPVVSYSVLDRKAAGAVVITASHNPAGYNGFKYKPEYAGSASPEVIAELERRIAEVQRRGLPRPSSSPAPIHHFDPLPPYTAHIEKLAGVADLRQSPFRVVVDSMYGAGAGILADLLDGGAMRVTELHKERNPAFPGMEQPEPIAHNLSALSRKVRSLKADVGLATDGDADRLGLIDERGRFVTQLQTMGLLALYLLDAKKERGPIVKSITTTSMCFKLGERYQVPVFETAVGFKHIGPVMMRENALIAGEESGGYGFRGHIPERDGILSGLHFLGFMGRTGRKPSALLEYLYGIVGPHYYDRVDLRFDPSQRDAILERVRGSRPTRLASSDVAAVDTLDGFRFRLADGSWSLVRFSGTEPLLRIYCETSSEERVRELLQETRKLAGV